jgi:hypothetical protein
VSNFRSRLRERIVPWAAKLQFELALKKPRETIKSSSAIEVLIDTSIRGNAKTHQASWFDVYGGPPFRRAITGGYLARTPIHSPHDTSDMYENITYLTSITQLARENLISFYTSGDLVLEQWRQPPSRSWGSPYDLNLLHGIPLKRVGKLAPSTMVPKRWGVHSLEAQQRQSLRNYDDPEYQQLLKLFGNKHSQDVRHLFDANKFDLFCFLTLDFKFVRQFENLHQRAEVKKLRARVMTPKSFAQHLGIGPVHPFWLSYQNADVLVRSDVYTWGKEK